MDPLTIGAIGAPLIGGIAGAAQSAEERERARQLREQMLQMFKDIPEPDLAAQMLAFEELQSQGQLTPELEALVSQGDSNLEDISTDPRLKEAQLSALNELDSIAQSGGHTLTDKANLNKVQSQVATADRGRREAIMQGMSQRGMGGSGFELASQLAGAQDSVQNENQAGLDIAAQAQDRALEAIMQGGQLSGQVREQDFSEEARKAQAQDEIDRFNALNQQGLNTRNIDRRNDAQETNLGERQRIADTNVGQRNDAQVANKGLFQNQFDNRLRKAQGVASVASDAAAGADRDANRSASQWAGAGSAVGSGFASVAQKDSDDKKWQALLKASLRR